MEIWVKSVLLSDFLKFLNHNIDVEIDQNILSQDFSNLYHTTSFRMFSLGIE